MGYSRTALFTCMCELNHTYKWSYYKEEKNDHSMCTLSIPHQRIEGRNKEFSLIIACRESDICVFGVYPRIVPDLKRRDIAELLSKINFDKWFGNAELDFSDGELRSRYTVDFRDSFLSPQMIRDAITITADWMVELDNVYSAVLNDRS